LEKFQESPWPADIPLPVSLADTLRVTATRRNRFPVRPLPPPNPILIGQMELAIILRTATSLDAALL